MCRHAKCSFPMTPRSGPRAGQTYVTCLHCGAELHYDWKHMRQGERIGAPSRRNPSLKQMLVAPLLLTIRLWRMVSTWFARQVLPHIHLFPRWHWH